jgi:hypothetical protein
MKPGEVTRAIDHCEAALKPPYSVLDPVKGNEGIEEWPDRTL